MSGLERGVRIIDRQSRSEETWHQEVKQHRMAELFFLKLNSSVRFLISCFSQQFLRRTLYKIRRYQGPTKRFDSHRATLNLSCFWHSCRHDILNSLYVIQTNVQGKIVLASMTATAAKTSLLKWISFFFQLCRVYSNSLKTPYVGKFPWSWFLGDCTQV